MTIGIVPISKIEFNLCSRHEIVPILLALQYLYIEQNESLMAICELIKNDVVTNQSDHLGCTGLNYWEILVLSSVRLGCDLDYDALQDLADNHKILRQMMMVDELFDNKFYPRSTIHDNLTKLTSETVEKITQTIVSLGHQLVPEAIEQVRGDSFVTKKNIHYPTDSNLLFDGIRKTIELSIKLSDEYKLLGWRQHAHLLKKIKQIKRKIEKVARGRSKNRDAELLKLYKELINYSQMITDRAEDTIQTFREFHKDQTSMFWDGIISNIFFYIAGVEYVCELAKRRIVNGETNIPHSEKVFSLFEPDTEMINRGKKPYPYEFGHRVMVMEDSAGFIIHSQVMDIGVTDEKILIDVMKNLQNRYNNKIKSASFDKGYWTPKNLKELSKIVEVACLPKKGKRSKEDTTREGSVEFGKARKRHAGIESAIHGLVAGNGLGLCRDKGIDGYKRYVALGVLGRNLQTLGRILIDKKKKDLGDDPLDRLISLM